VAKRKARERLAWGALPALTAYQTTRLADRIVALGAARGLNSEAEIAAAAGLSRGYIASVRRSKEGPQLGSLLALMTAFGLHSVDALLGPPPSWLLVAEDEVAVLGNLDLAHQRVVDALPPRWPGRDESP
jgi:transcriptional regulator with XRE-family HTH domain